MDLITYIFLTLAAITSFAFSININKLELKPNLIKKIVSVFIKFLNIILYFLKSDYLHNGSIVEVMVRLIHLYDKHIINIIHF